jgi:pilus assembly protein FimV
LKNRPYLAARTALAMAALAALSVAPINAQALGLGRLNVQSALGEGLRAEIDITSLSPEEASTLQVRIAPPEAFRAAGIDYNAVLSGAQATLARRADGRPYLRVTSDRAVQEPFVEVILELNSTSGRLRREFTLLFDPPGSRMAPPVQAAAPVSPVITAAPSPAAAGPSAASSRAAAAAVAAAARPVPAPAPAPAAAPSPAPRPARPAPEPAPMPAVAAAPPPARPAPAPRPVAAPAKPAATARAAAPGGSRYEVRPGDTLYGVAGRTRAEGISLDQMLVGLYRANPNAFIDNNVNRLRAGAVLSVPAGDEVRDVTVADAQRLLTAQSADFSAYRARLAQGAPMAQAPDSGRSAQGKVQASVDDRKQSAAPSPDKLKLSGGAVQASAPEAQIAQANERKDNAARVAELTRNVEELKKLQQGTVAAQAPAAEPAAVPAAAVAPSAPVAAGSAPATATLPAAKPAAAPPPPPPPPTPAAADGEPGLLGNIAGNPWLLPGAGLLAVLLLGFGAWRLRSRKRQAASETSFLESRMQPDSFFGASGGQRVDTRDAPNSNAGTMGYSLSQLDAIGDVDPVAEADVYLAYGRDLQAEEILKEAMRATPDRLAVRTKLLEVYAKRRDSKGFELLATQLYALTKGVGPDWAQAQELGRQFDHDNQLYQPGGHPEEIILDGERVVVEPLGATTQPHSILAPHTQPMEDSQLPEIAGGALDLDLDLSLDAPDHGAAARAMEATRPLAPNLQRPTDLGLDFDFEEPTQPAPRAQPPAPRTVPGNLAPDSMRMNLDDLGGDTVQPSGDTRPGGDTTLDFGGFASSEPGGLSDAEPTAPSQFDESDPLARKLELADEFRQIGDMEGARDLLEEVVAKSSGALRAKAQAMLDALG